MIFVMFTPPSVSTLSAQTVADSIQLLLTCRPRPRCAPATARTRACARAPARPPPTARWRSISLCTARVRCGCCIFSWARPFDSRSNFGCIWSSSSPSTRSASLAPSSPSFTLPLKLFSSTLHTIILGFNDKRPDLLIIFLFILPIIFASKRLFTK